jgi:hypothetical protein
VDGHDLGKILGLTVTLRFDQDQYDTINKKLDQLLAQLSDEEKAKLTALTAQLKASADKLSVVEQANKPPTP